MLFLNGMLTTISLELHFCITDLDLIGPRIVHCEGGSVPVNQIP